MPIAVCLIRPQPHYRRDAFVAGLAACGYTIVTQPLRTISPADILVIWNRGPQFQYEAKRHELAGSQVVVAENGYLDTVDEDGHQFFSLALDHHNGAGRWLCGPGDRWPLLGQALCPWRKEGASILVLPQRGMGAPGVAMPRGWENDIRRRLARMTSRPVRVRPHPGLKSKARPLAPDLQNVHAVVTWASGAALKALLAGVPVFHDMPSWVGASAARPLAGVQDLESPLMDDQARLKMFQRLAWCQWSVADIASGVALRWILQNGRVVL